MENNKDTDLGKDCDGTTEAPSLYRISFCRPPPKRVHLGEYFPFVFDVVNEYGESVVPLLASDSGEGGPLEASIELSYPEPSSLSEQLNCSIRHRIEKNHVSSKNRGQPPPAKRKRPTEPQPAILSSGQPIGMASYGPCSLEACIDHKGQTKGAIASVKVRLRVSLVARKNIRAIVNMSDLTRPVLEGTATPYCVLPLYSVPFKVLPSTSLDSEVNKPLHQYCERHICIGDNKTVILRERQGIADLGSRIWTGALVLGTYLGEVINTEPSSFIHQNVIELGSGCGLVGIATALLSSTTKVTMTDLEGNVLELLAMNVAANLGDTTSVVALDWERPIDEKILNARPFRFILVADCTYNESVYATLIDAIARLSSPTTTILISHTLRAAPEQQLLREICLSKGFSFDIVRNVGELYFIYALRQQTERD